MIIWSTCLIIAVIMLLLSFYYIANARKTMIEFTFMFLMFAGFFAYLPHYLQNYSPINAIVCDVVNLFQIVTINSNSYESYQPEVSNTFLFNIALIVRACVHIFSPILGVTAIYRFLKIKFEKIKSGFVIFNKRKIFIFSTYNERAEKIVEDITCRDNDRITVIFYETDKINNELDRKLGFNKISHISHKMKLDVAENKLPKFNSSKCEVFFFILNDGNENTELGLRLEKYYSDLCEKKSTLNKNNIHITVFSNYALTDKKLIDSIETSMDLRVVYPERLQVYKLLNDKPLFSNIKPDEKNISLLILDYNNMAKELLSAALCCGQLVNHKIKINIITENCANAKSETDFLCPELLNSGYSIHFFEANIHSSSLFKVIQENCMDTTYIALCGEDDISNIQLSIELRKFFLTYENNFCNMPHIAVRIQKDETAKILEKSDYKLNPFGYDSLIYNYNEMIDPEIEAIAKRVHFVYCAADSAEQAMDNLCSYYKFERDRKSNLSMALSIKYKLWDMGFEISEYHGDGTPDNCAFEKYIQGLVSDRDSAVNLKETALYAYDVAEHERWMAYQRSEGVCAMSVQQADVIARKNPTLLEQKNVNGVLLPRTGKSITMMLHMDICDFDDITVRTNQINDLISDVETIIPKRDTTFNDELIIVSLNKILSSQEYVMASGGKQYVITKITDDEN